MVTGEQLDGIGRQRSARHQRQTGHVSFLKHIGGKRDARQAIADPDVVRDLEVLVLRGATQVRIDQDAV